MTDIKQKVGQQIRDARKAKGLTQKELGEKLGVSEGAVNRYESGTRNISIEIIAEIAQALNMNLNINISE